MYLWALGLSKTFISIRSRFARHVLSDVRGIAFFFSFLFYVISKIIKLPVNGVTIVMSYLNSIFICYKVSWVQKSKLITDLFFFFNFSNCSTYTGWLDWPHRESFDPRLCKIGVFFDFELCLSVDASPLTLPSIGIWTNVCFQNKQNSIDYIFFWYIFM